MIVLGLVPLLLAVPIDATGDTTGVGGDSVVVLPEVRVSRPRIDEARRRMPTASVTVLKAGTSGRALETLPELLGQAAGVHVQQYGGLGAFSTVSLRGAPAGQVTILLDGMPLTSASHSIVSLGDLPATAVDRVEVYRGSSPLDLGPSAPGGAINLVTAFIASRVIGIFENSIVHLVALAALMPIVAGIGGNSGNQTITMIVRAIALGQIQASYWAKLLGKELGVALLNGVVWGVMLGLIAYALYRNVALGGVMALAMLLNLVLAALMGVAIPWLRWQLGRDPAVGSSVLITACTDSGGFFIFLGLATIFLV